MSVVMYGPSNPNPFQRDNHYVPRLYLKRFAADDGRVFTYRILVAHERVALWKPTAIRGIAYHEYLYTRTVAGVESDEIEKWLNAEFETPAKEPLLKAISDMQLSRQDWRNLIRFVAAQDVRTPVRLQNDLQHWNQNLQGVLDKTMSAGLRVMESAKKAGRTPTTTKFPNSEYIPIRVTTAIEPGQKFGTVKGEVIVGRGLWLFGIRHLLTNRIETLLKERWTILRAPEGLTWFTSDDPVIRLRYDSEAKYDFQARWGDKGTEIMLPLDSHHLLYTKIGARPPQRGSVVPYPQAEIIRRFIAEHAHRYIFAASPDTKVPMLRPRTVDAAAFRHEQELWRKWHQEQSAAERELLPSHLRTVT